MVRTSTINDDDSSDESPRPCLTDVDSSDESPRPCLTDDEVYMIRRMNLQAGLVDDRGRPFDVDTDEEADAEIRRELEQAVNVAPAPLPAPAPYQPPTFPPRSALEFRRPLVHPSRYDDPQERMDRVRNYIIAYNDVFYPAGRPLCVANRVFNVETGRLGLVGLNEDEGEVFVVYQEDGWGSRSETAPASRFRRLVVQLDALPHRPWVIS